MAKTIKLSVLLALTDSLAPYFKGMVGDYSKFFKSSQGAFMGQKKTYVANEGTIDEPTKRQNILVQTTVTEKFEWFKNNAKEYIDALFAQEATNASGVARTTLMVDGKDWGELSSLELLRLKSIVGSSSIEQLLAGIPVRSDAEEWNTSDNDMYLNRTIMESPLLSSVNITTTKEDYILDDPNAKSNAPRAPQVAQKTTIVELGTATLQRFSGQWSQRQKAEALKRRTILLVAITKALKDCNDVEAISSTITSGKIFGYLLDSQ